MKESRYGYLFIAPCILLILLVLGFPILYVTAISFTKYQPLVSMQWNGLQHYVQIFKDELFWTACKNTFVFSIFSVVFHMLLGMASALLLNMHFRGRRLVRTLYLLPWMLSYVVGAITWRWMLNASYGILTHLLRSLGAIDASMALLGNKRTTMPFVILANVWKQFPYMMLMFIAGLQAIPQEQYEAARIDGAGPVQNFLHVTLPNMHHVIVITSTLDFIWAFKQFDLIYTMTGGGPGVATEVFSTLVYRTFFGSFNFGKAAAYAMVLMLIVMGISMAYGRIVFKGSRTDPS